MASAIVAGYITLLLMALVVLVAEFVLRDYILDKPTLIWDD